MIIRIDAMTEAELVRLAETTDMKPMVAMMMTAMAMT